MKKMGSHIYYDNVDLNLKFDFDDLMKFLKKPKIVLRKNF